MPVQGHIVLGFLLHLDLEYVLVLPMCQANLLKVGEHEEVWHDKKGQTECVIHGLEPVMQNGQSRQGLESIAETCTHTEGRHQLLRYRLDIPDHRSLSDGTRRLENQRSDRSRWNANRL